MSDHPDWACCHNHPSCNYWRDRLAENYWRDRLAEVEAALRNYSGGTSEYFERYPDALADQPTADRENADE